MSLFLPRVFQSENKPSRRRHFKQVVYLFAFFFIAAGTTSRSEAKLSHKTVPEMLNYFQDYVKKARKEWNAPGVAVALVEGDNIYFINDGEQELGGAPVTENSIFCIMSCTKVVTVSILQQLVDEGRLSLTDKVVDHLPWFQLSDPEKTKQVEVRHLISHCVGLPGFSTDTLWDLHYSQQEILQKLKEIPMAHAPGQKYAYQNIMVGVAGLLIEKVTEKPLKVLVQERVFERLGMKGASMGPQSCGFWSRILRWIQRLFGKSFGSDPYLLAKGYQRVNGKHVVARNDEAYTFQGTSGINASTSDYAQFLGMLINRGRIAFGPWKGERFLSERAWKAMSAPSIQVGHVRPSNIQFPVKRIRNFYYGNGMYGMKYGKKNRTVDLLLHMGAGSGWRSFWMAIPDYNVGIVIFSNYGSINTTILPEVIAYKFVDTYFNLSNYDWSAQQKKIKDTLQKRMDDVHANYVAAPSIHPKDVAGVYEHSLYGSARVEELHERLYVRFRGKRLPLIPIGGPCFKLNSHALSDHWGDDEECIVTFTPGSKNASMRISLLHEGKGDFMKKN